MAKTYSLEIGPFEAGGMNTYKTPRALSAAEATTNNGVDYADGSLKALYGPGIATQTGATIGSHFLHLLNSATNTWRTSASREFACLDGMCLAGTVSVSYYTNVAGSSTPLMSAGANIVNKALGLAAPTAPTLSAGSGGITRAYRITTAAYYADLNVTVESNPSTQVNSANATVTLTFTAAPANTTNITYTTRVYASNSTTQTDPLYYLGSAAAGATTFSDTNLAWATPLIQLNWQAGGNPKATQYLYDHGTPPALTILANTLMGVPAVPVVTITGESPRGGILFGAIGSRLYWTMTGYPWYWPSLNAEELDDTIEGIVVDRAAAYVLTQSGVYVVTGSSDTALNITKSRAPHGCIVNAGTAAAMTPYGVVYPCREGIALFDGQTSRVLTTGLLSAGFVGFSSYPMMGAFQDNIYVFATLYAGGQGYFFDMADYPKVRVSLSDAFSGGITAMATVKPAGGSVFPGMHVLDANGDIKPWWPRFSRLGGSQTAWSHTTGYLDCGLPTHKKKWYRAWIPVSAGTVSVVFTAYKWGGVVTGTKTLTASGWLGADLIGDYLVVAITAGTGATVVQPLRVDYEVLDD